MSAGKFILFTVYYDVLRGAGAQAWKSTGLHQIPVQKGGERLEKKKKVTKRVPAPVNTVPLSELVNTFCKWAPDADANCWSGSVVEDVWTTPGVGMQLGGGGSSSLTLHPLSSRPASQTAVPEILFFSPKIRPLFSVGLRPHESGWTVRPNVVIKMYLFCARYLPVTQCDKWSVLTPQTRPLSLFSCSDMRLGSLS